jgi:hypothetical protein
MEKRKFLLLSKKYRAGRASEQEKAYLTAYYNLFDARPDVTEMLNPEETDFLKNQIKAGIKNTRSLTTGLAIMSGWL